MEFRQEDVDWFRVGEYENPRFWSRFGVNPVFEGCTVLDVGSGLGSLCMDLGLAGAKKVVGIDIKPEWVDFANAHLRQNYPQLLDIVEFVCLDLRYYDDQVTFDFIVSKDSFEHIIELDRMLQEMKKRLKPGGRIYTGFGPLYTSPYGDHKWRRLSLRPWGLWGWLLARIPWGHLFMESTIINMSSRQGRKAESIYEGLNKMSLADYRRIFRESGFNIVYFRVNQSTSIRSKILSLFRMIPFLEDYCTHQIQCILEKPIDDCVTKKVRTVQPK